MLILMIIQDQQEDKSKFIKYYTNELFELTNGVWILHNIIWKNTNINDENINNNYYILEDKYNIPHKIYTDYNQLPLNLKNIKYYKLFLDDILVNNFDGLIQLNKWDIPCEYTILLYFEGITNPICYKYKFGLELYYKQTNNKTSGYLALQNKKTEIESQLFILQNL